MLELKKIKKVYKTAEEKVTALKGINVKFRESEFVSILGQSGCGKTTLLNIIGGLDNYTSGDLFINGKSTKDFKDHDWDTYRNHSVGFVFQSYNLIPHQTVLSNVELALTLSGVNKKERRKRAKEVLKKVGLKDQMHKKPNQMSGGQMQRVAIARAIVNDPDILLADEPTGALDSKTSLQIMDLLKEIAKDRLVIMVTHNPEIATKYSTRIIKLLDGEIIDDSNPFSGDYKEIKKKNTKKTFMSFLTALSLSLNNLMTKKGRTFLTAFAGSIGIIGIALIMSLSNGVQRYINKVEESTLSSYPITVEENSLDMSVMMEAMANISNQEKKEYNDDKIHSQALMNDILDTMSSKLESNNLMEFKKYLDKNKNELKDSVNAITYGYNLKINIYNEDSENGLVKVNPSQVLTKIGMQSDDTTTANMMMNNDVFSEMLDNKKLMESQYDIVAGSWPKKYNEVVVVVSENNEISDYTLYSLGLMNQDELVENFNSLLKGEKIKKSKGKEYTYEDLLNTKFKFVLNTDYYEKNGQIWIDKSNDEKYLDNIVKNAEDLKIVGIIKPNNDSVVEDNYGRIFYSKELKEYVINKINESEIVKRQKENPNINVLTGLEFKQANEKFSYENLTNEQKRYLASLSQEEIANVMQSYEENYNTTYDTVLTKLGAVDLANPASIGLYPKDFDSKEKIINFIMKNKNKIKKRLM